METKFRIRNLKEVIFFLKSLPKGTMKVGLEALTRFILGDSSRGLKHDDPYKFVTRKRAYGKVSSAPAGYFSMKQFRYVAWITEGFTKFYKRTGKTSAAWEMKETNGGYGYTLQNSAPGAYYIRDDKGQAAQPRLVGWRKTMKVIADNIKGAERATIAAVKRWIAENRPKG